MRKFTAALIIGLIGLFIVDAETSHAQSVHQDVIQPKSTSPFEIARVVNRSVRLWSKNQIPVDVDLSRTWEQLGIDSGDFPGCRADCEATIYRHELDPTPGRELILKLIKSYNSCRFLIFYRLRRTPTVTPQWKLRGYIDHDFNRYQMARHHVVHAFGKH